MVMTRSQIDERLASLPGWALGEDGQLHKEYQFRNFGQAMLFASAVGHLAETFDHHPDILIHGYKHVALSVMSHDVQGITGRDFRLIESIEALPRRA